jgi:hypothetical protein
MLLAPSELVKNLIGVLDAAHALAVDRCTLSADAPE